MTKDTTSIADSMFSTENEVKSNFISWGKPGDFIVGTLASTREVENNLPGKPAGEMQTIYEFKALDGSFHVLDDRKQPVADATIVKAGEFWNVGGKKGIDAQMRNIKIGQVLGMKFMEEIPSKTKGFNPTKVVKIFTTGKMDTDFLAGLDAKNADIEASNAEFDAI